LSANIIVKWLFSHERLTKTALKCKSKTRPSKSMFSNKENTGRTFTSNQMSVIKWVCSQVWFRSIMSVKDSCGWLIQLNLLKLKLVEHILNFSRFHCDDGLIHWLTSSRFIVYWCFFVICSPSFERERERVLDSHNHASRFVLVHLAWPRDGNIFFLLSAHILHQKNMKKWSSMTKIFASEFGELPFWILFFSFLPFFQFWSNMSFICSAPTNVPTNVIKGGFFFFFQL
jgi:hypothetical protein